MTTLKDKSPGEKYWIIVVRVVALIIGFLPFIPNTFWYLGISEVKHPMDSSDLIFIVIGFVFLWGSGNFGTWANSIGKGIVDKVKNK